jgi:peptidoglycan/xylan/chitin deacetylase (PgdA/CDA1 family)
MRRAVALAASVLDRAGVLRAAAAARRSGVWPRGGLTVLIYHRIADPSDPAEVGELDPDLVDATPDDFDAQMAYLCRNFTPIGLEELLAAQRGERALPSDAVLVTFDDGYRDNHDRALPILQRHAMRAIFFITTGYLSRRGVFWWERISLLVRRCRLPSLRITYPAPEQLDVATDGAKVKAIRRLNRIVKDHFGLDLDRFLDELAVASGVGWNADEEHAVGDRALMTWDQVRALRAAGMGIGSHTRNHRVLQTLPAGELRDELNESRSTLERELGEMITTIAYPVGRPIAALPAVRQAVADAGYQLGFTGVPGVNTFAPGTDRLDLHRRFIDRETPAALGRAFLVFPELAR